MGEISDCRYWMGRSLFWIETFRVPAKITL
jgi:hypothetical protein